MKLYSYFTLILERLTSPEKELRGSATTAEDKGDRPWLAHTQTHTHTHTHFWCLHKTKTTSIWYESGTEMQEAGRGEDREIDQRKKSLLSRSHSRLDKHTTRQRTSENLLLHLGCDVFSLLLSHFPSLGLCVLVCVFPCAW